jgi:hypothetical protein
VITAGPDATSTTRTITIPNDGSPAMEIGRPSVWLLDGDHVWFGIDAGEWGGAAGRIDLKTGSTTMAGRLDGVYGFAARDGRVWAYGGTTHMGHTEGYIAELTSGAPVVVWHHDNFDRTQIAAPPLPVVALRPHGSGFLALVWNQLFDVDVRFTTWTKLGALAAREHEGRPDAVGNYPAAIAVFDHRPAGSVVIATRRDGLFVLRDTTIVPAARVP